MKIDKNDIALNLSILASVVTIILFCINIKIALIKEKEVEAK
jgi:hypothetical protein